MTNDKDATAFIKVRRGQAGVTPQVSVHLNIDHGTQIKLKRRMWEIN